MLMLNFLKWERRYTTKLKEVSDHRIKLLCVRVKLRAQKIGCF